MPPYHKFQKLYFIPVVITALFIITSGLSGLLRIFFLQYGYFRNRKTLTSLKKENLNLKAEIITLKSRLANYENLSQENSALKKMLRLKQKYSAKITAASVLIKSPWQTEQQIRINRGRDSGIKTGNLVISPEGNLVGKIIKVNPSDSWVRLSSDPNFKIAVTCGKINTILAGALFEGAKLLYIPYDAEIDRGNEVFVLKKESAYMPISVGKISYINKIKGELTQNVFVKLSAKISSINEVFVLIK